MAKEVFGEYGDLITFLEEGCKNVKPVLNPKQLKCLDIDPK